MAYRTAEQTRWGQFDFVVGYEIKLSQRHPCHDVCDTLAGKYSKTFKWTGWHPMDMCFSVSILKTDDEFWSDSPGSRNEVKDVPQGFKDWVRDNADRIAAAEERGTQPYFIRDNKEVVAKILKEKEKELIKPPHIEDYISHNNGKVMVSSMHGTNELDENLRISKKVVDLLDDTVYLLPRIDPTQRDAARLRKEYLPEGVFEGKNPDFLIKGKFYEGKTMNFDNKTVSLQQLKNNIENRIKKAKKQAENIILEVPSDTNTYVLEHIIINYLSRSKGNREIILFIGNNGYIYKMQGDS